jgi:hypothetical protein
METFKINLHNTAHMFFTLKIILINFLQRQFIEQEGELRGLSKKNLH